MLTFDVAKYYTIYVKFGGKNWQVKLVAANVSNTINF
jgi:hypothetical protein